MPSPLVDACQHNIPRRSSIRIETCVSAGPGSLNLAFPKLHPGAWEKREMAGFGPDRSPEPSV